MSDLPDAGEVAAFLRPLAIPGDAVVLNLIRAADFMAIAGFANPERKGRWTNGGTAELVFAAPAGDGAGFMIVIGYRPFIWPQKVPRQVVSISIGEHLVEEWQLATPGDRRRAIYIPRAWLTHPDRIALTFAIPTCVSPAALEINKDKREIGLFISSLSCFVVDDRPPANAPIWLLGRQVGPEARKTFDEKLETGFWARFMTGPKVLDIGFRGGGTGEVVPIMPGAIGVDLDYPGYDGRTLPFPDGSQDAVFASHCLEHIPGHIRAIQEWHRVIKPGGHIIIAVPHAHLYERRRRPRSRWNGDHQRFYTPASLMAEIEAALEPNTYRVRHLADNDTGYRYDSDPEVHPFGCYEITLVLEKIDPPPWRVAD